MALMGMAIVIAGAFCSTASEAEAHVVHPEKGKFFFRPHTYNYQEATPIDPLTFIFQGGGGSYSTISLKAALGAFHGGEDPMDDYTCNADQGFYYRLVPWGSGQPQLYSWRNGQYTLNWPDLTDLNMSNNEDCVVQNHIRIWDDYDHWKVYGGNRNKWAVGSIHHESRCPLTPPPPIIAASASATNYLCSIDHKRDRTFEQQARNLGWMMKTYGPFCVEKKWKALPGSFSPPGSVDYSDGFLTRITHVPSQGSVSCVG